MKPRSFALAFTLATSIGVLSAPVVGAGDKTPAPAQVTAKRLVLAERDPANWMTVKWHLKNAFSKLGVSNRLQAINRARGSAQLH